MGDHDELLARADGTVGGLVSERSLRELIHELAAALRAALAARPQLVQVGWYTPGMGDGPNIGGLIDGKFDDDDEPVYRVEAVAGSVTPTEDDDD